jgi:hypothetical protein
MGMWLTHEKDFEIQLPTLTMSYNTRTFKFGGVRSTVAVLRDGSCLEVRRGDITWTRAVREAIPPIQQQRWSSLTSWYATLPVEMAPVEEWHTKGGWNGPRSEAGAGDLFGLSTHLAYFMRRDFATADQILEAIQSYVAYQTTTHQWRRYDAVLCDFFWLLAFRLADKEHVVATLTEGGHMFAGSSAGPEWPSVTAFNLSGKRPILSYAEGDLEFSPAMMYFMGGWPTGTWADVQRVYEAYMCQKVGGEGQHPRVEEGYIVTDTFLRHLLQTKERLMPWSAFRRLLIGRGLVWNAALPALIVEPVEVARPAERRLSFGAPMEIDEDASWAAEPVEADAPPVAPSAADVNAFMARVEALRAAPVTPVTETLRAAPVTETPSAVEPQKSAPAVDPFPELDELWTQVWMEMEAVDDDAYRVALMEELLTIYLRDEYAVAWRTNAFKRIQTRAALRSWVEIYGYVEMVYRFLRTYPA